MYWALIIKPCPVLVSKREGHCCTASFASLQNGQIFGKQDKWGNYVCPHFISKKENLGLFTLEKRMLLDNYKSLFFHSVGNRNWKMGLDFWYLGHALDINFEQSGFNALAYLSRLSLRIHAHLFDNLFSRWEQRRSRGSGLPLLIF